MPAPLRLTLLGPILSAAVLVGALAACQPEVQKQEEIRPVRSVLVSRDAGDGGLELSGEVRPRIESRLGFRVAGKVAERFVDVGDSVRPGQVLARLDAADAQLQRQAAEAAVLAAEADFQRISVDHERFTQLRGKQLISDLDFRRVDAQRRVAESQLAQARAQAKVWSNQSDYTALKADAAGVVTQVLAEPGQVLAAGQPALVLAVKGEPEVEIAVPESHIDAVRSAKAFTVSLWAVSGKTWPARLRELAPTADPATRTYRARLQVKSSDAELVLGRTARVQIAAEANATANAAATPARIPLTAVVQANGSPQVWVVAGDNTVSLRTVQVSAYVGNDALIDSGLQDGERVVTAGANRLHAGQRVKTLEDTPKSPLAGPGGA